MKIELSRGFRRWCATSIFVVLSGSLSGCSGTPDATATLVKRQALQYQPDASIDTGPQLDAGTDTIPTSFEGWMDGNSVPPTLLTDSTAPSGQPVMQVTRNTAGGDYFSPWTAVTGGNTYCVSANIRWAGGSVPFVGIDTTGTWVNWLMGSAYTDPVFGATRVVSVTASGWQSLSRQIVMPAGATQARLSVELWDGEMKPGADEAYFDSVQIVGGSCAGSAPPGSWLDGSGVAATLVTDNTAPSGQPVMQVTRNTAGGDYFSPWTAVTGGNTYCVSANIRWVGGGIPFVGIDTTGTWVDWLMGADYTDSLFGPTTLVSATGERLAEPVTPDRNSSRNHAGALVGGAVGRPDQGWSGRSILRQRSHRGGSCWLDGSGVAVTLVN